MNKKFLSVLTLGAIGVLGLASCAPAQISPKEAQEVLTTMKKAYDSGEVKDPNKITLREETKTTIQSGKDSSNETSVSEAMVDLKGYKMYSNVDAPLLGAFETWVYYDNGNLISAIAFGVTKRYQSIQVNEQQAAELFTKAEEVVEILDMVGKDTLTDLLQTTKEIENIDINGLREEYGANIEYSVKTEYRSNKVDNFHFNLDFTMNGATIDSNPMKMDIAMTNKTIVENYRLKESLNKVTLKSNVLGEEFKMTSETKTTLKESASISLPNLKEFKQGEITLPDIPGLE